MTQTLLLVFASAVVAATGRSAVAHSNVRPSRDAVFALRGGSVEEPSDAVLQATFACNELYGQVLSTAAQEVAALRKSIAGGEAVPNFGAKADEIIADAVGKFEADMPKDGAASAVYESRAEELHKTLVTSLEPVFVQQVCLLKDAAMEQFKKGLVGDGDGSESLVASEAAFVRECQASVPAKTGWGYKLERSSLVGAMQAIVTEQKKAQQAKLQTAGQMQTALSYLQMQQQQMQALQAQYTGGQGGKWNLGGAYRPPDTNINLSASYQQGRTNVQISMVPDEGANLLGPNGFTQGVGPANLGLSFNIHV